MSPFFRAQARYPITQKSPVKQHILIIDSVAAIDLPKEFPFRFADFLSHIASRLGSKSLQTHWLVSEVKLTFPPKWREDDLEACSETILCESRLWANKLREKLQETSSIDAKSQAISDIIDEIYAGFGRIKNSLERVRKLSEFLSEFTDNNSISYLQERKFDAVNGVFSPIDLPIEDILQESARFDQVAVFIGEQSHQALKDFQTQNNKKFILIT